MDMAAAHSPQVKERLSKLARSLHKSAVWKNAPFNRLFGAFGLFRTAGAAYSWGTAADGILACRVSKEHRYIHCT